MSGPDGDKMTKAAANEPAADRMVVLGKLGGAFGVQGWMRISSFTDPVENILDYEHWRVSRVVPGQGAQWQPVEVEAGRVTNKGVLVKLAGIETPEQARLQVGAEIAVLRSELPSIAPGEFYWTDLEGLEALTPEGELLGRVDHFRSTPGGDIAVIRGTREHWVPFVKERIVKVDLEAKRIVLDWGVDWLDD